VAYLARAERDHAWAVEQFTLCAPGLLLCEPVLTETLFLLRRQGLDHRVVFALLDRGVLKLDFQIRGQCSEVDELMARYADLPMSLADACLVRMAELEPRAQILTLDRHFKLYRTRDRRVLRLRMPPERKP
jgi:predicted nucleic acid-binding protein